jgi:site-specific DNA-cytosine methylase
MVKRLLELFCGTKSVGNVFKQDGYEVISLDYNPEFDATHTADILTWDYTQYAPDYFNVIWASPDCTTWSLASGGQYRTKVDIYGVKNKKYEKSVIGNNMVLRVIEIIKYFKNTSWFIENPRGLMQHYPPLIDFITETNSSKTLVYYGNYNDWGYPKATNIWSNLKLWNNEHMPIFTEDAYVLRLHPHDKRMKRYYKKFNSANARDRSKIPPDLIARLKALI